MMAGIEWWVRARACMASTDKSLHTEEMQAVAHASTCDKGTIPKDADRFVILSAPRSVSGHVLEPLTVSRTAAVPTNWPKLVQKAKDDGYAIIHIALLAYCPKPPWGHASTCGKGQEGSAGP
jgi:hypothetical protein